MRNKCRIKSTCLFTIILDAEPCHRSVYITAIVMTFNKPLVFSQTKIRTQIFVKHLMTKQYACMIYVVRTKTKFPFGTYFSNPISTSNHIYEAWAESIIGDPVIGQICFAVWLTVWHAAWWLLSLTLKATIDEYIFAESLISWPCKLMDWLKAYFALLHILAKYESESM